MRTLVYFTARGVILALCFIVSLNVHSQDINYARKVIDTLASESMYGRGYVNNGSNLAAAYISNEMKRLGLQSFTEDYHQPFHLNIKSYPGEVLLAINNTVVKAGEEFMIISGSPSVNNEFQLYPIDSTMLESKRMLRRMHKMDLSNTFIIYNRDEMKGKYKSLSDSLLRTNYLGCAGFILTTHKEKINWSVAAPAEILPYPIINMLAKAVPLNPVTLKLTIELSAFESYPVSNVVGYIRGTSQADSMVVVTAHYDHLGMMGNEVMFPGANDNASGIAMMLNLAAYYMQEANQPEHSIAFMAFAGEEVGLKGANWFTQNPLFPLETIKFLINLDMVGTGSEGITMVNAVQFPKYYERMVKINADNEYLLTVKERGESCNSDHCPFYKEGVPAVFIYTMGKEHQEYHNIYDRADRVPLTEYEDLFRLLRDFIKTL